ncbi:MAG: Phosphate regulon transcriptional regulatory protein PhoB (SphR) [uncultured Rubrobacteraceae bacterium]|uniref:Phosphate regulon transcriptional regulatory protein PhoB (SphR) n=1 Tax=uncultured Rubrobacteraceae bacterium TaxID=349277 RepID=A0A6J4QZ58_9ACTN|nr:MAG: Phosphate regulon transcriptional regulatory protein PhoB (SphR) [uncultured Rubrobacteraceae bacterium]
MPKVMIVEDDCGVRDVVGIALEYEGMDVEAVRSGEAALDLLGPSHPFDLLILDVMLPGIDGIELCRQVRARDNVPIIMLTARDDETSVVVGLEVGADDYVTKPFSTRQLASRVRANLRRRRLDAQTAGQKLAFPGLVVDVSRRQVWVRDRLVRLTPTEFDILMILATQPGRVLHRGQILRQLRDAEFTGGARTIDTHIGHLRKKVEEDPRNPRYIRTEPGIGYRFGEDLELAPQA